MGREQWMMYPIIETEEQKQKRLLRGPPEEFAKYWANHFGNAMRKVVQDFLAELAEEKKKKKT